MRFYYNPSATIDGILILNNGSSFVYFKTPQNNIQDTLRIMDKDIELDDCRFSYKLEDLFYFFHKSEAAKVCPHTTRLLGNICLSNSLPGIHKRLNNSTPLRISRIRKK